MQIADKAGKPGFHICGTGSLYGESGGNARKSAGFGEEKEQGEGGIPPFGTPVFIIVNIYI
jgi:hypothetical protein